MPALAAGLVHGHGQARNAVQAVHCQRQAPALRRQLRGQARHAQQLVRRDDLVADEEVAHAARGQRLGFGGFLHAGAGGAGALQQQGDFGALVHLGVRPPAHLVLARKAGHALDVALHRVEVDDQRGRVDRVDALAQAGAQRVR